MKKLLATDFDGTWRIDSKISEENIRTLNEFEKDNYFGFVTGRNKDFIDNQCHKQEIHYDFIISCNGAYNKVNEDEKAVYIDPNIVDEIYELVKEEAMSFSVFTKDCQYEPFNYRPTLKKLKLFYLRKIALKEKVVKAYTNQEACMIEVHGYNEEDTKRLRNVIEKKYSDDYTILGDHNWFDITDSKADKKLGLEWIMSKLDINKNDVYCVGDGENDLVMLKHFNGYRIRKENGYLEDKISNNVKTVDELMKLLMNKEN